MSAACVADKRRCADGYSRDRRERPPGPPAEDRECLLRLRRATVRIDGAGPLKRGGRGPFGALPAVATAPGLRRTIGRGFGRSRSSRKSISEAVGDRDQRHVGESCSKLAIGNPRRDAQHPNLGILPEPARRTAHSEHRRIVDEKLDAFGIVFVAHPAAIDASKLEGLAGEATGGRRERRRAESRGRRRSACGGRGTGWRASARERQRRIRTSPGKQKARLRIPRRRRRGRDSKPGVGGKPTTV